MSPRGEVGLALLLLAVVAAAVVAGRRGTAPAQVDDRTSTFLRGPRGSEAVYAVLVRLGRSVQRRRTPLFDLARDTASRPDVLVLAAPPLSLEAGELDAVARYVASGGSVVGTEGAGGLALCAGWIVVPAGRTRWAPDPVAGARTLPPVRRVLVDLGDTSATREAEGAAPQCAALRLTGVDTLLRTEAGRPVIVGLRYGGGGRVTLLSDADYLRNRVWRDSDIPCVLVPLLAPPGARVSWDEYHQGFGDAPSLAGVVLAWLARAPAGWALVHFAVVALVAVALTAVRFGPVRPLGDPPRRSPLEHVEALAAGLERARGGRAAVQLMLGGLRRRLHRAGTPPRGDVREWLAGLELALPAARGREAAGRLRAIVTRPGDGPDVVVAAHAVEDVWEELHPRRTHA